MLSLYHPFSRMNVHTRQYYEKGASVLQWSYLVLTVFFWFIFPGDNTATVVGSGEGGGGEFQILQLSSMPFFLEEEIKEILPVRCQSVWPAEQKPHALSTCEKTRVLLPHQLLKATWNGADVIVQQAKFLSQVIRLLTHGTFRISLRIWTAE